MTVLPGTLDQVRDVVLRPYQNQMVAAWQAAMDRGIQRGLIVAATGTGKCLAKGTPVLLHSGHVVPVERVKAGDLVMGPDSMPRVVKSVATGREMLYRVTPTKGDPYTVNESHILSLKVTSVSKKQCGYFGGEVVNISVRDYLGQCKTFKHIAKGYRVGVDWDRQDLPIDPYVLGAWLGDGTTGQPEITTPDIAVLRAFEREAKRFGMDVRLKSDTGAASTYRMVMKAESRVHRNPFAEVLRDMEVLCHKHIPHHYLCGSRDDRLELLAGLFDTDGFVSDGGCDFVSASKCLAEDVAFLCRSLGFAAYVSVSRKQCTNTGAWGDYWRVSVSGDLSVIPTRVPRRKFPSRSQKKDVLMVGITVEPVGEGEYFGFELEGEDRRFLLGDFTVTHNTTVFSAIIKAMGEVDPGFTGLVLAHRQELLDQAASRIRNVCGMPVATHSGQSKAQPGTSVVVGSVQSLGIAGSNSLDWLEPWMVIVDEAHHAAARTYQNVFRRMGCYDDDGTYLLGVTATPHRLDNLALYGSDKAIFQEVVFRYDIVKAIKDGYLADLRGFRAKADFDLSDVKTTAGDFNQGQLERVMNVDPVNELAFKSWADVARDRPTIVFCAGVDHAKSVAEVFEMNGVKAAAVYGDMPKPAREKAITDFQEGRVQVLTNMDILTEGFDAQHCSCVVLLRPTQSWSLFTQMVGRGLRTLPGVIDGVDSAESRRSAIAGSRKADCIVIDIVGNTEAHGVGKSPKSKDIPSLQALVGLPDAMDLEGRTLAEAVDEFENLPEAVKAAAFRRPTSFSGLSSVLTQVEMLTELHVPEEAESDGCQLFWLKTGEDVYMLDIGGRSEEEKGRKCILSRDLLGQWSLALVSAHRNEQFQLGVETDGVFKKAERVVTNTFFGVSRFASKDAQWRQGQPTDKQRELLMKLGVDPAVLDHIDKGKASAMITMLMEQKQRRGA